MNVAYIAGCRNKSLIWAGSEAPSKIFDIHGSLFDRHHTKQSRLQNSDPKQ